MAFWLSFIFLLFRLFSLSLSSLVSWNLFYLISGVGSRSNLATFSPIVFLLFRFFGEIALLASS